jgi:site-specific recombinase XerD
MGGVLGVRVVGPLAWYASGFAAELTRLGYTPLSVQGQLRLMAHLSRWLADGGLDTAALSGPTVEAFAVARRRAGYRAYRGSGALRPLLGYLRGSGVAPLPGPLELTPAEKVLERFRGYLLGERAMSPKAAEGYVRLVRPFVVDRVGAAGMVDARRVTSAEVTAFVVAESGRLAPKTTQRVASALRALLRWWHLDGVVTGSLTEAVPKVAHRPPGLPKAVTAAGVAAMLASCDSGPAGRRDYAMLLLLARLGLRAGEVAGLQLGDVQWRAGQIVVRGKGNRRDLLPLPVEVGQAIADYLCSGRPAPALDRCVFIRVKAPHRGLTNAGVTQAVAAAARRAGLGTLYAHRLRHSAASAMLAAGAPLVEIGQVLRHRRPLTTAIYARVDVQALRALARPWPGGTA